MAKDTTPEAKLAEDKKARTSFVVGGCFILLIARGLSNFNHLVAIIFSILLYIAGLGLVLWGCHIWAKMKNRHWAHMFWGILAPIGYIVLWRLKDKSAFSAQKTSQELLSSPNNDKST